ncbi:MAG: tRNA (adenosine(37)-N6)-threonylcarbamoyltransferase complex transferase subunit TsaD [Candidatus Saccharibacteria bacterium]|nr:tRNA (adenosine(37)-N6)-threonylcarbamoyltransferase complex transferase subunit TsaD [Candidatus Saccharibacteria bacterium]
MKILGIETSCDETAAAIVEDGSKILSNVVVSQIDIFAEYGGVIPEVAARSHLEVMMPVVQKALEDAKCTWSDIDAIAVTYAPGLLGSLLIGTLTARTLAILHDKPLYAVHHLKSHVYANWLEVEMPKNVHLRPSCEDASKKSEALPVTTGERERVENGSFLTFPLLALVISGGHTQILYMPAHNKFEIIGTTYDDAVGECFDKVAKILGLPYPGGPSIAKAATNGDENKYKLPHPKVDNLDFSFSGLKTAVLRAVQKELGLPISHPSHDLKNHLSEQQVADFAASFQKTAIDILLEKLEKAREQHPEVKSIVFAGGVSANQKLREMAGHSLQKNLPVFFPEAKFSGDNGAMVAAAAYYEIQSGVEPTDPYKLNIYPRISIEN